MATGDHVRWRTATGTNTGIELGTDGPYTRVVRPDGSVIGTTARREVIAAAGTPEANNYAVRIARQNDSGMRVLTAAGLVNNTPGVSTRTAPQQAALDRVLGDSSTVASQQRGAAPTTQAGTGNS